MRKPQRYLLTYQAEENRLYLDGEHIRQAWNGKHPEGFRGIYRIHKCRCGNYFIAHHAVKRCSRECDHQHRQEQIANQTAIRSRQRRDAQLKMKCVVCHRSMRDKTRQHSEYCSSACRQKAYRERKANH